MADPFAIAGAIGLAAGLTSFIASTLEKSIGQINNGKHAHQRLRAFHIALQTSQRRMEAWARQWHGHEKITRDDSRFLWGPGGLREVEIVENSILEEHNDILRLLYGSTWLTAYSHHWTGILQGQEDALRQRPDLPAPPAPSDDRTKAVCTCIAIALWKNNLLSTSVERLKGLVDSLETTSKLKFHEAQKSADHHGQPSGEEIENVIVRRRRMQHLARALSAAYQKLRPSAEFCELVFTDFDKAETCRLETQNNELAVTFLITHPPLLRTGSQFPYRRLHVRHPLDSVHKSVICDRAQKMLQSEPKAIDVAMGGGHTMRDEFLHIVGLDKHQQDVYRESIEDDCMKTAVRISAWSMLTWKSRWLSGLSSCRLVQVQFPGGRSWPVFNPGSCLEPCTSSHLESRPYLLLAVILAELALACPIVIISTGEDVTFDVPRFVERYLSGTDLLEEIRSATSWYYGSAVKYCLEQDASTCSSSGPESTYNHAHFYRKVVEPLDRHYGPLRKHIEDHAELYENFKQEAALFPVARSHVSLG